MSQELVKRERSKGKGEGWINEREPFGSSWRGGFPLKTSEQAVELTSPFSLIGAVLSRFKSDSSRPYGLQFAKLLCPWDSPGKNTGKGS